ncbi:hypothetical protein CP975_29630 [Streptomyces alboniger]|uniref:Uncharacterized protein n=1 Tax=Streptomyces alboniger TaxID=132473 RepID=A0A5J6HRT5_STRAD|nr:hypothetical protein CP975_29630 [Streptomyces alboniger]
MSSVIGWPDSRAASINAWKAHPRDGTRGPPSVISEGSSSRGGTSPVLRGRNGGFFFLFFGMHRTVATPTDTAVP